MDVEFKVTAAIDWRNLIRRVRAITEEESADNFCEYDAKILENAAAEIRRKLAEAKKGE